MESWKGRRVKVVHDELGPFRLGELGTVLDQRELGASGVELFIAWDKRQAWRERTYPVASRADGDILSFSNKVHLSKYLVLV